MLIILIILIIVTEEELKMQQNTSYFIWSISHVQGAAVRNCKVLHQIEIWNVMLQIRHQSIVLLQISNQLMCLSLPKV
jgi:hypothetical protein